MLLNLEQYHLILIYILNQIQLVLYLKLSPM